MGGAMAGRLRRAGFAVTVWNRTRSTAEAVASADIVLSSLADDAAVKDVYTGAHGAARALRQGTVVLETSTIAPQTIHDIRPAIEERGAALLDAPVSGSVSFVEKGQLTVMVGGDPVEIGRAHV